MRKFLLCLLTLLNVNLAFPYNDTPYDHVIIDNIVYGLYRWYTHHESRDGMAVADSLLYEFNASDLILPSSTRWENLREIAPDVFAECNSLNSVTYPYTLQKIDARAFKDCINLSSINFSTDKNNKMNSIGEYAFAGCTNLTSVDLSSMHPYKLDYYGSYYPTLYTGCFSGCTSLQNVNLPTEINIGSRVFENCSSLESIVIHEGTTDICRSCFEGCISLTKVSLPAALRTIEPHAFGRCSQIREFDIPSDNPYLTIRDGMILADNGQTLVWCLPQVEGVLRIPDSVIKICEGAFDACSKLTTVQIPASVSEIEQGAFSMSPALANVIVDADNPVYSSIEGVVFTDGGLTLFTLPAGKREYSIPSGNIVIANGAFQYCSSLETITIPDEINNLPDEFFKGCTALTTVNLSAEITSIGKNVFDGCTSLKSIHLPAKTENIQDKSFAGATALEEINIDSGNASFASFDGMLYDKACLTLLRCPEGKSICSFSPQLTTIGVAAFRNCSKITSISFPSTLTSVGKNAFDNCRALNDIEFTSPATEIGIGAFASCKALSTVKALNGLSVICRNAFLGCKTLKSVQIGGKAPLTIQKQAFMNCYALEQLEFPQAQCRIESEAFKGCKNLLTLELPAHMYYIGEKAFSECTSLSNVSTLGDNTVISAGAFQNCSALRSLNLLGENNVIDSRAFQNCTNLVEAHHSKGTFFQGDYIYSDCEALADLILPEDIEVIPVGTFYNCKSLSSLEIPASIREIGKMAFYNCCSLNTLIIPDRSMSQAKTTYIRNQAFTSCSGLESIELGKGWGVIEKEAFSYCSSLKTLTLSDNWWFNDKSFTSDKNNEDAEPMALKSVIYLTNNPVESGSFGSFTWNIYCNATLYLLGENYQNLPDPWCHFFNKRIYDPADISDIAEDTYLNGPIEIYNLNGMPVATSLENLPKGIYIVRQNGETKKISICE